MATIRITRKEEQITTKWAGGTTTQLYIYPETSTYSDRNFKIRVSTALVQQSPSVFTLLNDVNRVIMVLEGELTLICKGREPVILSKFDTYCFDGGIETSSTGTGKDFNLMLKGQREGSLSRFELKAASETEFKLDKGESLGFYLLNNFVSIYYNEEWIELYSGDFVFMEENSVRIRLRVKKAAEMVLVRIRN